MATQHWYAGETGESYTEQTKHADRDCHHLDDADTVRPISSDMVDEDDTCGVCSGSFRSEDSSETDGEDSDEVNEDEESDDTDEE